MDCHRRGSFASRAPGASPAGKSACYSHAVTLTRDARLLFVTRAVRTFAYGLLAVILALFLAARGFSDTEIGLLFTLTLVGDAVLSLGVSAVADRFGRKRVLVASCVLVVLAGGVFATTGNAILLTLAAIVGTISPSGAEVGPFLSIEQAAITQEAPASERTRVFGFYQLTGSLSNATGALAGGRATLAPVAWPRMLSQASRSSAGRLTCAPTPVSGVGVDSPAFSPTPMLPRTTRASLPLRSRR